MPQTASRRADAAALRRLWAPWRSVFLTHSKPRGCFLCASVRARPVQGHHVMAKGRQAFVILNRYPYNNGHVMIAPVRHVGRLERLQPTEWLEMLALSQRVLKRLNRRLHPQGYNLGFNLGRAGGAGVPGHLHLHIVPRWNGDTNFMPVLGQTKVISQSLDVLSRLLKGL
ncbi:MAG: HIT family hydrolase [Candidatus Omnitrophica bacterium CG11_big_fil_rev_8_21_14_0_20_63_9]|nr:MAG: HIT family hydrolase [Candidatus Omnitrophica bacterium CG11_big_fil_rev_8_21_14_0_20_63_9]